MSMFTSLKAQAKQLKQHTLTVYFAARDPRTPLFVRALAVFVAAYALSPIDLIPDFIPVIGYLDDLLLVPLVVVEGQVLLFAVLKGFEVNSLHWQNRF